MNSEIARRRWRSPRGTSLFRHSLLIVRTKRSATEFRFGLCGGSLRHSMPAASRVARNAAVNSGSRSMNQVALAAQEAVDAIGQVAPDLLDPRVVRVATQTGDVHAARLKVD